MSSPIEDARLELARVLEPLGYRVYANPTENPVPPCIQIFATGEWMINPRAAGRRRDLRLALRLSVPVISGSAEAWAALEQMVWDVTGTITEREPILAPKLDSSSSTECYVVDLITMASVAH